MSSEIKALFLTVHFLLAGAAIYFGLIELKKTAKEEPSGLTYIINGILIAVSHALIFGLFSAFYFNVINPEAVASYRNEAFQPLVIQMHDSLASTPEEYYDRLMAGKDSGILLPEKYEEYKKAANDSLAMVQEELDMVMNQSFGYYSSVIKWVGFAPFIGILFSAIVTIFVVKRRS